MLTIQLCSTPGSTTDQNGLQLVLNMLSVIIDKHIFSECYIWLINFWFN